MSDETKKPANKIKMSRTEIREALDQIPLETIISGEGKKRTLTAKQKGFVRDVAMGETKAQAYRNNYNSKTKPKYQGDAGYKMSNNPVINQEIEAFKVALLAREYQEGTKLKAFIMHQLTLHALNEDNPPASRIRSLELLGKSYDVGLFMEARKESTINNSVDIKAKLIEQLKDIMYKNSITIDYDMSGESLLDEIEGKKDGILVGDSDDPTPEMSVRGGMADMHTIPDSQSEGFTDSQYDENNEDNQEDGVGGIKKIDWQDSVDIGNTPVNDLEQKG
jgi:hypothetical protein